MSSLSKKRTCSSLRNALETEPVLMTEEPDATLAAFLVLFVAALFVAGYGSGLARLLRLDPPGVPLARLPLSWLDLLCFQLVMIVGFFVGAALPAALLATTFGAFLMIGPF